MTAEDQTPQNDSIDLQPDSVAPSPEETTPEAIGLPNLEGESSPAPAPDPPESSDPEGQALQTDIAQLETEKAALQQEVEALRQERDALLQEKIGDVEDTLKTMVRESLDTLEQEKQALQQSIEKLERRRERIREEMRTTFAGVSQEMAIRVQGFKEYLVGSLQDLVIAAEQLDFPQGESDRWDSEPAKSQPPEPQTVVPPVVDSGNGGQSRKIRQILDQYRTLPDYYGPPWQLRRTFEPIHAERVETWFFRQNCRGAIKTMGSRLQNILVASAVVSVMHRIHGDRLRTLVLANTPERLGEWRRGLQDCLGISRTDFGPTRGVVLFESPDALIQKADRLTEENYFPLVIMDETEAEVNLGLLQFPQWLAFAPDPQAMSSYFF